MAKQGRRRKNPRRDRPRKAKTTMFLASRVEIGRDQLQEFLRGIRVIAPEAGPINQSSRWLRIRHVVEDRLGQGAAAHAERGLESVGVQLAPDLPAAVVVDTRTGELQRLVISCAEMGPKVPASVHRTFRIVEMLVPAKLCREELGDAIERIAALDLRGWALRLKLFTTVFWISVNALRVVVSGFDGKKRSE